MLGDKREVEAIDKAGSGQKINPFDQQILRKLANDPDLSVEERQACARRAEGKETFRDREILAQLRRRVVPSARRPDD